MATLATQVVPDTGLAPTTSAATVTTGDKLAAGAGCFLYVRNDSGSTITVTITSHQVLQGDLAVGDRSVSVSTATFKLIAIPAFYANTADSNLATVVCSAVTSVVVAALRI